MISVLAEARLDLFEEHLRGFECRDLVLGDGDGGVLGYVAGSLLGASLYDERAEAAKIYVLAMCEGVLDNFHKLLDRGKDACAINACGLVDFVDDVSFSHNVGLVYDFIMD